MRKLLLVNIGAAVACGGAAVGVAYAITHKLQDNKSTTVSDINGIFKKIQTLYDGQASQDQITDANYKSLYAYIQESIAGTIASLTTSQNKAITLQQDWLNAELAKVKAAMDAHAQFDSDSFSDIYTAIEGLNARLDGVDNLQTQFLDKLDILRSQYQGTTTDLYQAVATLQTNLDNVSASNTVKFSTLEALVNNIQAKLLDIDELRNMVNSTNGVVELILERMMEIEMKVDATKNTVDYNYAELKKAYDALAAAHTLLQSKMASLESEADNIWTHLGEMYKSLDALKSKQDLSDADVAAVKTALEEIANKQNDLTTAQTDLASQFTNVKNDIANLFVGNATLQSQINYLDSQNTQLYQQFLYLQSAIHNLEELYYTGSSTTVSIKPTGDKYVIYEKDQTHSSGMIQYPSIEVPNLANAKRFAIYIKVTNTSTTANTSYITQVIDAYPDYDYKLIGSSTQGFNNEQFLVSVALDRNVNKININGLWMRKSSDAWKTTKDIDNTKVEITNVVVTY